VWSQLRVLLTGELRPGTSEEDTTLQLALAEQAGMAEQKARFMLLDPRTGEARSTRYKVFVHLMSMFCAAWQRASPGSHELAPAP
jgi:hypothetical protein